MEKPEAEKSPCSEETSHLSRNRSFKTKQLVRSQAIRESQSPPRTASPSVVVDAAADVTQAVVDRDDVIGDVTATEVAKCDDRSDVNSEDGRRQQVEIQITSGTWDEDSDQRQRTKRWLGKEHSKEQSRDLLSNNPRVACVCGTCNACPHCRWLGKEHSKEQSRDLLSNNPRVACVCGTCNACPHCRGRRRKYLCPTKQDSGIVCSDDCPDCSDTEPNGGSNSDGGRKTGSLDRDEPTHYCRCPERKEKSKTMSFSRTDSDDRTEMTEEELVKFIQVTLNKNARDRMTLLKIERELHGLINDPGRVLVRFPVMTSYGRMLVHRCASLFELNHNIDLNNKTSVLVSKSGTCGGRIPCTSFKQWCTTTFPPSPQRHHNDTTHAKSILKRDTHSLDEPGSGALSAARSKSLEQREREYERVRRRIFSSDNCTQEDSSQWQWLNSGPIKLLTPEGGSRNKLLKVHSVESAGGSQRSTSARGPVSKSHSFGGYTDTPPRQISRQGDLASSSWRLSPSSSGYRTLSLHSTDSVTPSPTGGASPEPVQNTNTEGVAVMWAVTDFSAVPVGALVIHPQTGRPLTNPDGSLYHFDPANPPVIDACQPAYTTNQQKIDVNNEKKRGRLEKQHSFIDNECECQPSDECKSKCCCELRRHESCHRNIADKNTTQTEQKVHQKPTSPCKTRYEQPAESATNHNPPPDIPTNHRPPYEPATNQKPPTDHPANHRSYDQSYSTNHRPTYYETNQRPERQFEIQRPPSYDAQKYDSTNQRHDLTNHRAMRLTNHGTPEIQYVGQQFQQYSHDEVSSPQACHQQYIQQEMGHITQVTTAQETDLRPMSLGMVYPGLGQYYGSPLPVYQPIQASEEQKQMAPTTISNNTFTIDPSYPYAPVDYATQCAYEPSPAAPQAPPPHAPPRPYALYTPVAPVEPMMQYQHHHYPYGEHMAQWQSMQAVVQVPHAAPKLFVPELYPLVQYPHQGVGGVPVYPHYNVMYPQVIPQPYPVYQTVHQLPDKHTDTRRGSLSSHRHSKRNSVSGSSRNTPLTTTPEEKQVPYEDHAHSTNPAQNVNQPCQSASLQTQTASLQSQNQMHHQNPSVSSQSLQCQNTVQSQSLQCQNTVQSQSLQCQNTVQSQSLQCQNTVQSQSVQSQNQHIGGHSQSLQRQNSGLSDQQSCSKDPNDLAAKIKQINDQMSQLNTGERDGYSHKRDGRRDEWKRRNSGNGILGSYPLNHTLQGRPHSDDTQLSSAARAIVNSIRSMQAKNHYQDRRPVYNQYRQDRDRQEYRHRREDKDRADTDRRQLPVYTPQYLLRQMSPGTWCRRSPAPIHPVLNPRRPHPDSRGGRR